MAAGANRETRSVHGKHVLAAFDELACVCDCSLVHGMRGHSRVFPSSTGTNLAEYSSLICVVEHTFLTAQPHAHVRFRRAIERRALWLTEDAARELPNLPLEDSL